MSTKIKAALNSIAFVIMVYINYLSNALPINGKTPGQLSDLYVNYFVPAGFTFAIWGIIYSALLVFVVCNVLSIINENIAKKINASIEKLSLRFVLSCVLNVAWLLAWHYQFVLLSVVIMALFLLVLINIFTQLNIGQNTPNQTVKWVFHLPFALYLGWICVAMVANVTAYLVQIEWTGWLLDFSNWAIAMIIVAFLVLSFMAIFKNAVPAGLVGVWALYGIYAKRLSLVNNEAINLTIAQTSLICLLLLAAISIFRLKKWFAY